MTKYIIFVKSNHHLANRYILCKLLNASPSLFFFWMTIVHTVIAKKQETVLNNYFNITISLYCAYFDLVFLCFCIFLYFFCISYLYIYCIYGDRERREQIDELEL